MKPPPDDPEFQRFTQAMREMMKVSKVEIQKRIEAEKQERRRERPRMASANLRKQG